MSFQLSNALAVKEIDQRILFSVYPNPSHDIIHIQTEEKILEINIYTPFGQKVIHQSNQSKQINISELSRGMYLLELVSDKQRSIQKILIQ